MVETHTENKKKKQESDSENDFLLRLSLLMMHQEDEEQEQESALTVTEEEAAQALGFEDVEKYRDWRKTHAEGGIADLPEENIRRITRKSDGTRNEEGYARLGALAKGSLLSIISKHESGGDYNIAWGKRHPMVNGKTLSEMTIDEVLAWQASSGAKSDAAGRYQIIEPTLRAIKKQMGLRGDEKFDPAMQDRMALHLLKMRGFDDYLEGRISEQQFMKNISQEWASLPKDFSGLSYYHGDGLNKAGVDPITVMSAIRKAREEYLKTNDMSLAANGGKPAQPADKVEAQKGKGPQQFQQAAQPQKPAPAKPAPSLGTQFASAVSNAATTAGNAISSGWKMIFG